MRKSIVNYDQVAPTRSSAGQSLWIAMRPRQWVKNLFVLTPLLFSQRLLDPVALGRAGVAFILFCLMSSSIYLLNDVQDCERDRLHPQKRARPIAAGDLRIRLALAVMGGLFLIALACGIVLDKTFALILLAYWIINLLYSSWLKHQVILDVFVLAAGFVLRVVGGGIAIADSC